MNFQPCEIATLGQAHYISSSGVLTIEESAAYLFQGDHPKALRFAQDLKIASGETVAALKGGDYALGIRSHKTKA